LQNLKSSYKEVFWSKDTSNKAVSLRSFPLLRWAVPVVRSSLRSTDHSQRKKQELRKKSTCFFLCFVPSLHTVTSCVRRGYCICKATSLRCSTFSSLCICHPLLIWRLLNRQPSTSIGTPKGLKF
jgi:hypothetical protein